MTISIKFTTTTLVLAALLSQPAFAGLFGPSTELLKGESLAQKLQSQPVVVSVSGGQLDVRSKAAAVGGFLLGFVASSALASGGMQPGMSAQQMNQTMQANMQIATAFNQNLQTTVTQMASEQAVKPTAQVAKEGPVIAVSQQLLASLMQTPNLKVSLANVEAKPALTDLQLQITQPEWKLDFSMGSSDYTLLHHVVVALYQKESDTIFFKETCAGEYPRKMSKEDWERDDFAAVAVASREKADQCAAQVMAALGLAPVNATVPPTNARPSAATD